MLSRRTPRPLSTPLVRARRRGLRRGLPALALGVTALALAAPTSLPAAATPGVPSAGARHTATVVAAPRTSDQAATRHLTAAAQQAGLEVGNATMGWRERGTERVLLAQRRTSLARAGSVTALTTTPPFTPAGVLGIDVSSYQGKVKWSKWAKQDKQFAYVKATEGTSYRNPRFADQYGGAAKAGLIRGAYHFASPNGKAGYLQARYFVKHGGGWTADGQTLPGVLDIEYNPYGSTCYGVSKKKMVAWTTSFTTEYKKLTGKDAVIYSTTDWWKRCTGNSDAFADTNPLWIARYGTKTPGTLPNGWTKATFWQYTSTPLDSDVFPGKLKQLKKFATKA